jgi:molybdate transport system regulatory protein
MRKAAVRFRVELGPEGAVGPGKIALLEHIDRGGSLSQAARELGMSYRRAWQLLDSLNHGFRERVVVSAQGGRRGGGATLTAFGRRLIRSYRDFDSEVQARAAQHFRAILREARGRSAPRRPARAPVLRLSQRGPPG